MSTNQCSRGKEPAVENTYKIKGMTCGHCVGAVTQEVSAVDGVDSVTVDLDSASMTVTSNAEIGLDVLSAAVDEAGYELVS
ncbi:MAG: heavy-metal-associated domain-containing protein [Microthrixaceae bacterium]|nr:heavy-metal-associated domain-containing protein [Microthrixaceae bacterium]